MRFKHNIKDKTRFVIAVGAVDTVDELDSPPLMGRLPASLPGCAAGSVS